VKRFERLVPRNSQQRHRRLRRSAPEKYARVIVEVQTSLMLQAFGHSLSFEP
jgi:hypothetical protein